MDLLLIRHGHSVGDDERRIKGSWDVELTPKGLRQAKLLKEKLEKENYECDLLFSSPLKRAAQTAEAVSQAVGKPIIYDARLREQDSGKIAGMTREEASKFSPPPDENGHRNYIPIPGGESLLDHTRRVSEFYLELIDKHMDKRVCMVTHGGTINVLLRIIYNLPVNQPYVDKHIYLFAMNDTAMSRLLIRGPQDVITYYLNNFSHLITMK